MGDRRVNISVRDVANRFLTVWPTWGDAWVLCARAVDDKRGTAWIVRDIDGTSSKLLVKDGGSGDGSVVTWVGGAGGLMLIRPYQPGWAEQVVQFDALDSGYVAVNNHDKTRVMDRSTAANDDPFVISYPWNGGRNQHWLLRDH